MAGWEGIDKSFNVIVKPRRNPLEGQVAPRE